MDINVFGFEMTYEAFWIIAMILFGILEAATLGIVSIWFVLGALMALVVASIGAPVLVQVSVFLGVSIIMLIFTKPLAMKYFRVEKTNTDEIIGKTGKVVEKIENVQGKGQVKVNGLIWSAISRTGEIMDVNTMVTVLEIKGVKLVVQNKKEEL